MTDFNVGQFPSVVSNRQTIRWKQQLNLTILSTKAANPNTKFLCSTRESFIWPAPLPFSVTNSQRSQTMVCAEVSQFPTHDVLKNRQWHSSATTCLLQYRRWHFGLFRTFSRAVSQRMGPPYFALVDFSLTGLY